MSLEETYQFDEKTDKDEGQDAMDDIDAFEARMRGEVKAPAKPLQTRVRIPAVATTPSRADARDRTHVAGQQAQARRQAHEEGVRIRRKRRREGRACTPQRGPAHPWKRHRGSPSRVPASHSQACEDDGRAAGCRGGDERPL